MSKGTILIIDKEQYTQWAMRTLLEIEGYVAVGVNSVEGASEEIRRGGVCGIITEYRADQHCTLDLIRELKKGFPEVYVMMLTGEDLAEDKYEEIMEAGVDDYFLKPLSTQKILIHLRKGLGRRTVFC